MAAFNEQILQGSQRPNFFELLAQKAMQEALRSAFEYVCKVGNPPFRPPPPPHNEILVEILLII